MLSAYIVLTIICALWGLMQTPDIIETHKADYPTWAIYLTCGVMIALSPFLFVVYIIMFIILLAKSFVQKS